LAIAERNARRLTRLVNQIVDADRIGSGRTPFVLSPVKLAPLVGAAIEACREEAHNSNVRVRFEDGAPAAYVRADAERLLQAVCGLVSNGAKFSPPDAEVVVSTEARGEEVRISVRDRGPGVPAEFREAIFEKFVQVEATDARQKGGLGLGLTIVRQIMTALGGRVTYDAGVDGGAMFHLDLPAWADARQTGGMDSEIAPFQGTADRGKWGAIGTIDLVDKRQPPLRVM
jgi:signal transduction histidine kinase